MASLIWVHYMYYYVHRLYTLYMFLMKRERERERERATPAFEMDKTEISTLMLASRF